MARAVALGALLALFFATPARAQAPVAQVSSRLLLGGGAFLPEGEGRGVGAVFDLALRADLLFGERRPERFRIGPLIDLRSANVQSFEAGGGVSALLPFGRGLGLGVTGGYGYGFRRRGRDGPAAFGSLSFAYRPYNYFSAYGWAAEAVLAARVQTDEPRAWEVTLSLALDLELVALPVILLLQRLRGSEADRLEEAPARSRRAPP